MLHYLLIIDYHNFVYIARTPKMSGFFLTKIIFPKFFSNFLCFRTFRVFYKKIFISKNIFLFVCIVRTPSFAAIFGSFFARYIREITVFDIVYLTFYFLFSILIF